jgi:hypothetical protein
MGNKSNQADVEVHIIRDATQPHGVRFEMQSDLGNGDELTF